MEGPFIGKIFFISSSDDSSKSFDQINTEYLELHLSDQDILNRSKISNLVMTNNPFDLEEWKLFEKKDWNSDVYLASLRLDDILLDPNKNPFLKP